MSSVRTYGGVDEWSRVYAEKAAEDAAEAERLRRLLSTAREGLRHAMMDLEAHGHTPMAERAEAALERSDPSAE